MEKQKYEDLLSIFSLSLAMVACAILVLFSRDPSITGYFVSRTNSFNLLWIIMLLILVLASLIIGIVLSMSRMTSELEKHRSAIIGKHSELSGYVASARKKGFSEKEISSRLNAHGWDRKEISKHMK